jgi:DNA-binding transcriptional MerR regulator
MTGVTVRTLRNYVTQGLMTPTELRGTATRYERRELLRLLAVMRARKENKLSLENVKCKLDAFDERELEAWILTGPLPPAAAVALGVEPAQKVSTTELGDTLERWNSQLETLQRIQLLPGLELTLGPHPSPAATRAALEICREYLG